MSNSRRYILSPLAEFDLEEIWFYSFQKWLMKQADRYHAEIVSVFDGLTKGHLKGRPVDIREGYFRYPVGSHVVFYRTENADIVIVRILHGKMDANSHL